MSKSAFGAIAVAVLCVGMAVSAYTHAQSPASGSAPTAAAPDTDGNSAPAPTYTAEALETLLAPIALYPDPVLAQVLASSTNPQEVLDAGNWLIANSELKGSALSDAATEAGFTPPMMAVMQFPTVVDMMCMKMDWTTELGTAFQADQPGVLDAVQRLRKQAAEMGNLENSEQMKVTTTSQNNQQIITVQPADPQVVYVPQYNPTVVYTTPAPTTTTVATTTPATTTVVEDDDDGYSGGEMITAGLLSFGAGMLVNEVFNDDDDDDYYSPNWGYGGSSYYPPPYYPRYGNGYRPADSYRRPANYQHGFNNNNIYVDADGKDYFNRFDSGGNNYRKQPNSPISAARPNRPELAELNRTQQTARRNTASGQTGIAKPQGTYTGARQPAAKRPEAVSKVPKGTYAGAANPAAREKLNPQAAGARDRGHVAPRTTKPAARPQQAAKPAASKPRASATRSSAFKGSQNQGRSERAASQRGRASMAKSQRQPAQQSSGQRRGNRR